MAPSSGRQQSGIWSRNLRTLGRCSSDSDSSGSGSPAHQTLPSGLVSPNVISEDARLMKQMDLSSRQDQAVYKPNPWSIAQVNAATRPQPRQNRPDASTSKSNPGTKMPPQGRIVDGFRRQTEKAQEQPLKAFPKEPVTTHGTPIRPVYSDPTPNLNMPRAAPYQPILKRPLSPGRTYAPENVTRFAGMNAPPTSTMGPVVPLDNIGAFIALFTRQMTLIHICSFLDVNKTHIVRSGRNYQVSVDHPTTSRPIHPVRRPNRAEEPRGVLHYRAVNHV